MELQFEIDRSVVGVVNSTNDDFGFNLTERNYEDPTPESQEFQRQDDLVAV